MHKVGIKPNVLEYAALLSAKAVACLTIFVSMTAHAQSSRAYENISQLKIMAYNVENLFWSVGKYEYTEEGLKAVNEQGPQMKPESEIIAIRNVIKDIQPDIGIITEVESKEALDHLVEKNLLGAKYNTFLVTGNDMRGIDIGFIVKADLPFHVELKTNKQMTWHDPTTNKEELLFSRDAAVLVLRKSPGDKPFLAIMGNHAKSKRDRPRDPESSLMRKAQYDGIEKIRLRDYPDTPVVLAGDFNTDVRTSSEIQSIKNSFVSAFDTARKSLPENQRITHSYHPYTGPTSYSQMDDIRMTEGLQQHVIEAGVYAYKNKNGSLMPLPTTYQERNRQPSDHRPVFAVFSTMPLKKIFPVNWCTGLF